MKLFTDSRIEGKTLKALIDEINKISEERFHEKDLIGRVYEYFLQAFSINADKEEGEFYTPHSIVELICELIEPYDGTIYDPCCGSGGMFVQAQKFVEAHGGNTKAVQVYGQESQPETYRLAKMNLAVRGISYNLGTTAASTFTNDLHKTLKASYVMANPPFNLKKWRTENELVTDIRWAGYGVPPVSNANYAWILHMLSKLNVVNGVAGFLLANGALGDSDTYEIRRKLIENDKVEAIIVLPREMFYSTDISVTLWILNQNKKGGMYHNRQLRNRTGRFCLLICAHGIRIFTRKSTCSSCRNRSSGLPRYITRGRAKGLKVLRTPCLNSIGRFHLRKLRTTISLLCPAAILSLWIATKTLTMNESWVIPLQRLPIF